MSVYVGVAGAPQPFPGKGASRGGRRRPRGFRGSSVLGRRKSGCFRKKRWRENLVAQSLRA